MCRHSIGRCQTDSLPIRNDSSAAGTSPPSSSGSDVDGRVRIIDDDPAQFCQQSLRLGARSDGNDVIHPVPVVAVVGALPKFREVVGEGGEIRPPVEVGGELEAAATFQVGHQLVLRAHDHPRR